MINQNKKKKAFLDYRLDDLYVWSVFPVNYIRHLSNERHRIGEFCKLDCMFFKHQYHEYNQELQNICALTTQCIVWRFDHFHFRNDTSLCDNSSLTAEASNYEDACTLSEKAIRGNEKRKRREKQWLFFN